MTMNDEQYLSVDKIANRYQVNKSTIWRWAQITDFPQPIKLHGITRWKLTDIQHWEQLQDKAA